MDFTAAYLNMYETRRRRNYFLQILLSFITQK